MPTFALLGIEVPESVTTDFDITAEYKTEAEAQAALDELHALGVKGGEVIELEDTNAPSTDESDATPSAM
jgi:hypothetical protein